MSSYVSAELRRLVTARADGLCEYCLVHESDTFVGCTIDHVISEKHGGLTIAENLALACAFCNRRKGTDLGSVTQNGELVRLFNPRADRWTDHFVIEGVRIVGRTDIGHATARLLGVNDADRLLEREALLAVGRFPHPAARARVAPPDR